MRLAIPVTNAATALHAGHASKILILTVDPTQGTLLEHTEQAVPELAPGAFPAWLASLGVQVLLTGGLGPAAHRGCDALGIKVVSGIDTSCPATTVAAVLRSLREKGI